MLTTATINFSDSDEKLVVTSDVVTLAGALDDIKEKVIGELDFTFNNWQNVTIEIDRTK